MSDERYVTLAEVKEMLEEENATRELSNDQKLAMEHAQKISKLEPKEAKKLKDELTKLDLVSEAMACKLVDILPSHSDDVRVLFAKERLVLEKKYIDQILKIVEKYL